MLFTPISSSSICLTSDVIRLLMMPHLQLEMEIEVVWLSSSIIHVFPFNSEKKQGGVVVKLVYFSVLSFIDHVCTAEEDICYNMHIVSYCYLECESCHADWHK